MFALSWAYLKTTFGFIAFASLIPLRQMNSAVAAAASFIALCQLAAV
jgi:hypothetical protein